VRTIAFAGDTATIASVATRIAVPRVSMECLL
jgi:hypothetical protein